MALRIKSLYVFGISLGITKEICMEDRMTVNHRKYRYWYKSKEYPVNMPEKK